MALTEQQKDEIRQETGWSDRILEYIDSPDEARVYINAGLKETKIDGRTALVRSDIDWNDYSCRHEWLKDKLSDWDSWQDYNNADLVGEGYPPRDKSGDPYELHHIGQRQDSPFAELTWQEHMSSGNNTVLHQMGKESEIDRQQFKQESSHYWQSRYKTIEPPVSLSERMVRLRDLMASKNAITSVEIANEPLVENKGKVFECLNEYVKSPLNDKYEVGVKKVFSTAISAAKSTGVLPTELQEKAQSTLAVASVVDEGLTRVKTAYQVATGELHAEDVADALIDHAASRVITGIKTVVKAGADIAVKAVGNVVEKVFPPAKVVMPVVKKVVTHVAEKVSNFVATGVKKVASVVKNVAHKAIEGVRKAGRKILSWLGF